MQKIVVLEQQINFLICLLFVQFVASVELDIQEGYLTSNPKHSELQWIAKKNYCRVSLYGWQDTSWRGNGMDWWSLKIYCFSSSACSEKRQFCAAESLWPFKFMTFVLVCLLSHMHLMKLWPFWRYKSKKLLLWYENEQLKLLSLFAYEVQIQRFKYLGVVFDFAILLLSFFIQQLF